MSRKILSIEMRETTQYLVLDIPGRGGVAGIPTSEPLSAAILSRHNNQVVLMSTAQVKFINLHKLNLPVTTPPQTLRMWSSVTSVSIK